MTLSFFFPVKVSFELHMNIFTEILTLTSIELKQLVKYRQLESFWLLQWQPGRMTFDPGQTNY